jgi:hypothetical protein
VFHVKRFYVPLGAAAVIAVVFALTFALGQTSCPQGYTLTAGRCVQNAPPITSGQVTTALGYTPLASLANIAIGPANATISGTVNIKDSTPTTGATLVNIGLGASQTTTAAVSLINVGSTVAWGGYNAVLDTGANNAIAGTMPGYPGGNPSRGLCVTVFLQHTLQAGANTFNLNSSGAFAIGANSTAGNITRAYVASTFIHLCANGSGGWLDLSQ